MPFYINNVEITDEQVFAEMQHHPALTANEAMEKAATALAIRELLLQEARGLGFQAPDAAASGETQEDYLINRLLEQEVVSPLSNDEECERYYQRNPNVFRDHDGNSIPFATVRESIAEYLNECSEQKAMQQYIKILIGKARIAGISLEGTDSPLVQ